jgi:hypothetical protein
MKLVCIYQTHILHPSVNEGVTAEEVRHSEEVSSSSYRDTNVHSMSSECFCEYSTINMSFLMSEILNMFLLHEL